MHLNSSFFRWESFLLLLMLTLAACTSDKGKNIPDVSHIDVDLTVKRFEKGLFSADTTKIEATIAQLDEEYPVFFKEVYLGKILPPLQDPQVLMLFVTSPNVRHLYDTCITVYADFDPYITEFKTAFRFYRHYFPDRKIPELITYISEYTLGNFTLEEDMLGVGLDFFLGADYPYYNITFFPKYLQASMDKDHLVSKTMHTLTKNMVGEPEGDRMIDIMVNNGKILYVLDQLLPRTPDSIKLEYSAEQTAWCENNELQVWSHFLKEDLLYSTKMRDIRKLVDYSPNSPGMPPEAPGRTANWLGWQIVKSFMKRNPDTSMEDLILLTDAQELLQKSKYKPKR